MVEKVFRFDWNCLNWDANREWNQCYLHSVIQHLTPKFRANGYLFLSDLLTEIGLPLTKSSVIGGWRADKDKGLYIGFVPLNNSNCFDIHVMYHENILDVLPD